MKCCPVGSYPPPLPFLILVPQTKRHSMPSLPFPQDECKSAKHAPRLETLRDILARKAAAEAKSSAARGGGAGGAGAGGSRSARSLKAIELLLDELARD